MAVSFSLISKVTVFCDASLKEKIINWGQKAGATGNTWFTCHGKGRHEVIADPYTGADRVGIVFLCSESTADKIVEGCIEYQRRGVTVFKEKVEVPQSDTHKFTKPA
jgi:hypothetical protein